jgi:hypothetical protein
MSIRADFWSQPKHRLAKPRQNLRALPSRQGDLRFVIFKFAGDQQGDQITCFRNFAVPLQNVPNSSNCEISRMHQTRSIEKFLPFLAFFNFYSEGKSSKRIPLEDQLYGRFGVNPR